MISEEAFQSVARANAFAIHNNVIIRQLELGKAEAQLTMGPAHLNPYGKLHGGANMALAETVAGALSTILQPTGERSRVFGIEVNGNHMRQAQGAYVTARGCFLHRGKRTHVVQVEIRDEQGTLVTVNRVTNMIV